MKSARWAGLRQSAGRRQSLAEPRSLRWRALRRLTLSGRGRARGRRLGVGNGLAAFTVGEPHVVDRVLDRVETRARGKHPPGEDAPHLALQRDLVDLDETVGERRFG